MNNRTNMAVEKIKNQQQLVNKRGSEFKKSAQQMLQKWRPLRSEGKSFHFLSRSHMDLDTNTLPRALIVLDWLKTNSRPSPLLQRPRFSRLGDLTPVQQLGWVLSIARIAVKNSGSWFWIPSRRTLALSLRAGIRVMRGRQRKGKQSTLEWLHTKTKARDACRNGLWRTMRAQHSAGAHLTREERTSVGAGRERVEERSLWTYESDVCKLIDIKSLNKIISFSQSSKSVSFLCSKSIFKLQSVKLFLIILNPFRKKTKMDEINEN